MGPKKEAPGTDLVLYSPDPDHYSEGYDEREAPPGLLFPTFFYLSNNTGIIGLPTEEFSDKITVALPYKVEMVRDKEGSLFTRLRLFYPKTYINIYKSSIVYEAIPIPSAEFRLISTLLYERKRDFQRLLYDLDFDQDTNFEYFKQRKIELESLQVK